MQRMRCLISSRRQLPLLASRLLPSSGVRCYETGEYLKTQSDHYSGTMAEVGAKIRERTGVERGYHVVPKSRKHLLEHHPKKEQLPARSMQDSYTHAILPLSVDEMARERYINHLGRVRMGRLMEELDMFAVWLCHRHINIPDLPKDVPLPYTFVTLLVDRIDFSDIENIQVNKDIEVSGFISWVGNTSMEATIYTRQLLNDKYLNVTKAVFLMVARNAINSASAPVNPLKPADAVEQKCWEESDERQRKRKATESQGVLVWPPQQHEQAIMYNLLQRTTPKDSFDLNRRALPPKCNWMEDSQRSTMMNPFPENRNAHNTIFGGFLMRQAIEISFITASIYMRGRPILMCLSDISFLQPVKVTAFLQMTAYVVYTDQSYIQVMTVAKNWQAESGEPTTTNVFYVTYKADKIVDEVLPRTYREMLWYIHGRRKLMAALNLRPDYPMPEEKEKQSNTTMTAK
ncbi:acyl-coenzyme A thioesterase 9, mitochondrial isoform X1 [Drosophila nasuta]|uniref:acyl-coenzyme A thioesterase 9, mitochondrial isoform X1 n=1 Tax=Drosophila nasuta TaxID=42062 RepID=UPI00295E536A|nr:acyl-coenzyme A thioesterase 9, mitochondrial isoform X1 [Drosophila nasuta]